MGRVIWVTPDAYFGEGNFPPGATPEKACLKSGKEYLVIKIEYDEKYNEWAFLLVNDHGEAWSLSNRHLRISRVFEDEVLIFSLQGNRIFEED